VPQESSLYINFRTGGNSRFFVREGWSSPEDPGTWNDGKLSRLRIPSTSKGRPYACVMELFGFRNDRDVREQRISIECRGRTVFTGAIRDWTKISFQVPKAPPGEDDVIELDLVCPDATIPSRSGDGSDGRELSCLVSELHIQESTDDEVALDADIHSAPRAKRPLGTRKVAAVCMVFNEPDYLPIWIRHYSRHVGAENCFVIDHGSTDGSTENLGTVNVLRLPRSPYDPVQQSDFNSKFCASLLCWYDWILYSDVDEIFLPDPAVAGTLLEYCQNPLPEVVTAIGMNVLHAFPEEGDIDLARPITEQRRYAAVSSPVSKPNLLRRPVTWAPGSHSGNCRTVFDDLYMFHLRWFDLGLGMRRLDRTRKMAWARDGAGSHQRVEDEKMSALFQGFARLNKIPAAEFSRSEGPIAEFIAQVLESRKTRERDIYKISLDIWGNSMLELPIRFRGAF
jgi:hypothetical protein